MKNIVSFCTLILFRTNDRSGKYETLGQVSLQPIDQPSRMISMTTKMSKNNGAPAGKDRMKKADSSGPKSESQVLLANALGQIEKTFGKGSIMKLSDDTITLGVQGISTGALSLDLALGGAVSLAGGSSSFSGRSRAAKPRWPCTPSPEPSMKGGSPPSSMPSMPSTPPRPSGWGSISRTC